MSSKLRHASSLSLIFAGAIAFNATAEDTPKDSRDTMQQSSEVTGAATGMGTAPDRAQGGATERNAQQRVTPQAFAQQAAVIGQAEVELSQLALKNTKNEEVRLYAERMVRDHKAANEKLKKIAAQESIALPQSLDAEHRAKKQKLAALKDDAFDREYKKEMAMGHDKAVALFQSASQTQQMPEELREFAASTLRTLKNHREAAHDMHEEAQEEAQKDGA